MNVDMTERTIAGLVVPYGPVGLNRGRRWRYAPRSLRPVGRVPLLVDHQHGRRVGRAIGYADTPAGLAAVFVVARGSEGDQALGQVLDGTLRGLSAGVDLVHTAPDEPGVTLVLRAQLREVSLTAAPVFDLAGAR